MVNSPGFHPELVNLSDFDITFEPTRPGSSTFELHGRKAENTFRVECTFGYERPSSPSPEDTELEPDTFYIEYVDSPTQQGLGSAATAYALGKAKERGFSVGRMDILDPRMVGVVEKLHRLRLVQARFYLPRIGENAPPRIPTADVPASPNLITAEEASRKLEEAEPIVLARIHANQEVGDALFTADCVVHF